MTVIIASFVLLVLSVVFISTGFHRYGLGAKHTNDFLPGFTLFGFSSGLFTGYILGVIA